MAAGLSAKDCCEAFANYVPGVTNLNDLCCDTCEITMNNGEPVELGDFKEQAGPTVMQEVEKYGESKDGSMAWCSFWCENCISQQLFATTAVLEKQSNGGYKMLHVHRGAGVTV